MTITADDARELERAFLDGLDRAQDAYEQIIEAQAWLQLGHDTYADWWRERVQPLMRALSMRPTREVAAAGIEQIRREDAELPPAQRHTQRELGELFGVGEATVGRWNGTRSTVASPDASPDLGGWPADSTPERPAPKPTFSAAVPPRPVVTVDPFADWSSEEKALFDRLDAGEIVVVSMRGQHNNLIAWATEADLYVRIDRRTEWGNPFELPGDGDRATVIGNYDAHYLPYKPSLLAKLDTLRGKVLGCWCAPEPCHGDILKARAEA